MDDRLSNRQMIGTLIFIIAGPILWAVDLTAIYAAQSSLCAFATLPQSAVGGLVIATTAVLVVADVAALVWPRTLFRVLVATAPPDTQWPFIRGSMRALGGLAALSMGFFATASLLLPACAQLR